MYVLQVQTGFEDEVVKSLKNKGFNVYFPKQIKYKRRLGKWHTEVENIFKGYVFVECNLTDENYLKIKDTLFVNYYLKKAGSIVPDELKEKEVKFIKWLSNNGEPIEPLEVKFTLDNQIVIRDERLDDLDFEIVQCKKRQKRMKVKIDFFGESKILTFAIKEVK